MTQLRVEHKSAKHTGKLTARHPRGSRNWIPGSVPDLFGTYQSTLQTIQQIRWDHRSAFMVMRDIQRDPSSKMPFCAGIHPDASCRNINNIIWNTMIPNFDSIFKLHMSEACIIRFYYIRASRMCPGGDLAVSRLSPGWVPAVSLRRRHWK